MIPPSQRGHGDINKDMLTTGQFSKNRNINISLAQKHSEFVLQEGTNSAIFNQSFLPRLNRIGNPNMQLVDHIFYSMP